MLLELILILFLTLILCLATSLILYARWNYGLLESLGIPVIKPHWLLGSVPDVHKKVQHFEDLERVKKYGPIYALYEGRTPQVHVADPELIKAMMVKDYDYFRNRRTIEFGDPYLNEMLDWLPEDRWRYMKTKTSQAFSPLRIKKMSALFEKFAAEFTDDMLEEYHAQARGGKMEIDLKDRFGALILDAIAQSILGITIEDRKNPRNEFAMFVRAFMGMDAPDLDWKYTMTLSFPFLTKYASGFALEPLNKFVEISKQIFEARRTSGQPVDPSSKDLVDILNDMLEKLKNRSPEVMEIGLKEETIWSIAFGLFLASYDTINSAMTLLSLYLSKNPEIQERLVQEIESVSAQYGGAINNESVKQMEYFHACVTEILRLFPVFFRPERICCKDWSFTPSSGSYGPVRIKKGITIIFDAWAANRNPDIYPNPEEFNPERFLGDAKKELDPYANLTFGHGPKSCIGKSFTFEMTKIILGRFLKEFRFLPRDDAVLKYRPGLVFMFLYEPLLFDIVKRN